MNGNCFKDFIRKSPHIAIYHDNETISYNELYDNVNRYANKLRSVLKAGDEILIFLPDCPEYFYLFWGSVKVGVRPMLLNTMLKESEVNDVVSRYSPNLIFSKDNIDDFDKSALDTTDFEPFDSSKNDICFYLFSSGTTGYVKRIPHAHKDIVPTCINYAKKTLYMNAYDICYSAAKLPFAYGLGNSMTFPLFVGASTVLVSENSSAKNTLDNIEKFKPTIYFGVPSLYAYQLKSLENKNRDLSSLRVCVSAGERLPSTTYEKWLEKTTFKILDGIGTTEALHIFISNRHEYSEAGCTGKLVPGYKAKIVDIDDNDVADGEAGYLKIKGESLLEDGWFDTGDVFVKTDNKFYYKGRKNDMLKIGGVWVSPSVIEEQILKNDNVLEAVVLHSCSADDLDRLAAYIVLKDDSVNKIKLKNQIKKTCIDNLPVNHYPYYIEFVEDLPKTPTGKIQKFKLRVLEASVHR
jgi:acyl-coenzyme A synthetase/AMP-(fatty) acid ligase